MDTLVLDRADVLQVLTPGECLDAVEAAFVAHAHGHTIPPGILGARATGGGFHIKSAGLLGRDEAARPMFAAKVNANFPGNPDRTGWPTIQGVIALFDASNGCLLALLDSIEITSLRTAAATAVAAKYLAPETAIVTICGCGEQGRSQLRALASVRSITRVMALDIDAGRGAGLATEMSGELGCDVDVVHAVSDAARDTTIWVTCTPALRWFLGRMHVAPGAFVAAVGADNPDKQEIEPALLAANVVIADILEQCATIGDLHHAIDAGVMQRADVRGELAGVVSGRCIGRRSPDEIIIFDSTGTALQDVAVAALVYERAVATGIGLRIDLGAANHAETVNRHAARARS